MHVAGDIGIFGAEWCGEPERIRAERRWEPGFSSHEWLGRVASVGNLFFHRWVSVLGF